MYVPVSRNFMRNRTDPDMYPGSIRGGGAQAAVLLQLAEHLLHTRLAQTGSFNF